MGDELVGAAGGQLIIELATQVKIAAGVNNTIFSGGVCFCMSVGKFVGGNIAHEVAAPLFRIEHVASESHVAVVCDEELD